jgi:hypothetical protein
LVKAYSLELLVDAVRQHQAGRPQPSPRRLSVAFGRALRGTGRLLTRLGDRLASRQATPSVFEGCL